MMKTRLYYVTCDSVTAEPSVVFVSTHYADATEWRDQLERRTEEGTCRHPHPIRTHEVILPS